MFSRRTPRLNVVLRAGNPGGARAVEDHADFADVFADDLQCVQQRRTGNDCRPVLIVMKHRNRHRLAQRLFDLKTLRRFDVLQVDAAEGRFQKLAKTDDLFGVFGIHFQVENINVSKALEKHALAFHHRLAGQRSDVAETQHRRAVGDRPPPGFRGPCNRIPVRVSRECPGTAPPRPAYRPDLNHIACGKALTGQLRSCPSARDDGNPARLVCEFPCPTPCWRIRGLGSGQFDVEAALRRHLAR